MSQKWLMFYMCACGECLKGQNRHMKKQIKV